MEIGGETGVPVDVRVVCCDVVFYNTIGGMVFGGGVV